MSVVSVAFGKGNILVRVTMVKPAEVKLSSDIILGVAKQEEQRKEAQVKIKMARRHLTQEVNMWDK